MKEKVEWEKRRVQEEKEAEEEEEEDFARAREEWEEEERMKNMMNGVKTSEEEEEEGVKGKREGGVGSIMIPPQSSRSAGLFSDRLSSTRRTKITTEFPINGPIIDSVTVQTWATGICLAAGNTVVVME